MSTNISGDFQICISIPEKYVWSFYKIMHERVKLKPDFRSYKIFLIMSITLDVQVLSMFFLHVDHIYLQGLEYPNKHLSNSV